MPKEPKQEKTTSDKLIATEQALRKTVQQYRDYTRIERKAFRESARIENALTVLNNELVELLRTHKMSKKPVTHRIPAGAPVGIIHLSDAHFNELVDIEGNRYDFPVAAKRLRLLAHRAKKYFAPLGVKKVLLANTGDMLNSDRRIDEMLNQATNRSKALFISVSLLEQFILDLNESFNIAIAAVSGNESRIRKDHGFSEILLSDNYDFAIHNTLKYLFRKVNAVEFIDGDPGEKIVSFGGKTVLLMHGECLKKEASGSVQCVIGRYANKGILIDFVLFGHLHAASIGDFYARSGSLVGSNAYAEKGLNLMGSASQNVHVFYQDGNIDSIKVGLQHVDGMKGYSIDRDLESYNAKSATKLHKGHTILEIRV
jgi:predicted phosphodiesterase